MVPEFDVKKINSKISHDVLANIFTLTLLVTVVVYFFVYGTFNKSEGLKFGIIAGIILLQVMSHFLPKLKDWDFINSGGTGALLVYNVTVTLLFIWFIPLYSPFVLILPALMFITIYYRGLSGFIMSVLMLLIVVGVVTSQEGNAATGFGHYYPYLTIILGVAFAGIIQRISAIDNDVRNEFQRISNRVDLDREQLNSLIGHLTDAVLATDKDGVVQFHNDAATNLFGIESTFAGKHLADFLILYDQQDQIVDVLSKAQGELKDMQFEDLHLINSHKEKIYLYIDITPITSSYNQQTQHGFIILLRDISKEKTLDEQRNEFIAVAADELRTPIAIAEGNVSVMLSSHSGPPLDQTFTERLKKTHESIVFLGQLVEQLDLLRRAEMKALQLDIVPIIPSEIMAKLAADFQQDISRKNLQLQISVAPNLAEIQNSAVYIQEILRKYLSNAIKYTDHGTINIQASPGQPGCIRFSVTDTGKGIGQSDKAKLFHKFYRSEDYHTRQTRGSGLGLYTVLKIAQQLNARVGFESELNKGSTFYLEAPSLALAPAATSTIAQQAKSSV